MKKLTALGIQSDSKSVSKKSVYNALMHVLSVLKCAFCMVIMINWGKEGQF